LIFAQQIIKEIQTLKFRNQFSLIALFTVLSANSATAAIHFFVQR